MAATGKVWLVGAGPGDPELLTVKAVRVLSRVDVVVYDRLVSAAILDLVPQGVTRIFAGKAAGHHVLGQDEINRTVAGLALAGHEVARLKGGDPFVFGRGGEEALDLRRRGIPFEVVPGPLSVRASRAGDQLELDVAYDAPRGWHSLIVTADPAAPDLREPLAGACADAGLFLREITRPRPTLEHVFMRLSFRRRISVSRLFNMTQLTLPAVLPLTEQGHPLLVVLHALVGHG